MVVTFPPLDGDATTPETVWESVSNMTVCEECEFVWTLICTFSHLKCRELVLSEAYFKLCASPTCAHRWHSPLQCPWSSWTCWGIFYRSSESGLHRHPRSDGRSDAKTNRVEERGRKIEMRYWERKNKKVRVKKTARTCLTLEIEPSIFYYKFISKCCYTYYSSCISTYIEKK